MPTEAEWEYAARAGTTTARYGSLDAIAWYDKNSGNKTHEVGQKQPNAWGLYDMLGNVFQWTADWYDEEYYAQSPWKDPMGPAAGKHRVIRGGSWNSDSLVLRSSYRDRYIPGLRFDLYIGFRCVREVFRNGS